MQISSVMSSFPPELSSLIEVFGLSQQPEHLNATVELLARLHTYSLTSLRRIRGGWPEQCLLEETSFLKGYVQAEEPAPKGDRDRIQSFLEHVRSAPGLVYEPVQDPSGRIQLA